MITLTLDASSVEALAYAISVAHEETCNYFEDGDVYVDHGSEWPDVAAGMVAKWQTLAKIARELGEEVLAEKCEDLAQQLRESEESKRASA